MASYTVLSAALNLATGRDPVTHRVQTERLFRGDIIEADADNPVIRDLLSLRSIVKSDAPEKAHRPLTARIAFLSQKNAANRAEAPGKVATDVIPLDVDPVHAATETE